MIETIALSHREITDIPTATLPPIVPESKENVPCSPNRGHMLWQVPRFAIVGMLNATLDLLVLNGLLWLLPTTTTWRILLYTVIAYGVGAINSFLLNKYWTFGHKRPVTWQELTRFAATNLFGLSWNLALLWLASVISHPLLPNTVLWTNASKIAAIGSAAFISFLGMRLWVFVKPL